MLRATKRLLRIILTAAVCAAAVGSVSAQHAYLLEGDEIFMLGDSVGSQDGHQDHMKWILDALYPDAGIKIVNAGSGGKSSGSAITGLEMYPATGKRAIVTVMYGLNDLRWNWSDMDVKVTNFVQNMTRTIELAREKKLSLIFLRETHLTRGAAVDHYAAALTAALEMLLNAQDVLAAENNVPVIDVLGAYRRAHQESWIKDLEYRFAPDMIHPIQPGHAAVATEILRAFGVGLPLGDAARGPLHLAADSPIRLEAVDQNTIIPEDGRLAVRIRCRNLSNKKVKGTVTLVAAPHKQAKTVEISGYGMQVLDFEIPVAEMQDRWRIMPLYMVFAGDGLFTAEHALFQHVRITPADKPFTVTAEDFGDWERIKPKTPTCPVTRAVAIYATDWMSIEFKWPDQKVVAARPETKRADGRVTKKPLDLNANGAQLCDAVEFMFDLRPKESTGRFNCAVGQTPRGVVRLGIYKITEGDETPAKLMLPVGLKPEMVSLEQRDPDTFILNFKLPPAEETISWSMRVTDADDWGKGRLHQLTGKRYMASEPMGYIRHGRSNEPAVFFRVGY
ncbi:MAG: SGNH/GDSL hydrolase family protein [Lentisphaerae bacterium]|nr:SGNH/GDSL hydrolase family protein [Lentisphaerota bacterium]